MSKLSTALQQTPLGALLTAHEAAELTQHAQHKALKKGAYLFHVDDPGNALHIVLQGSLEVVLGEGDKTVVVATMGPGQVVGELEVMTGGRRVAGLVAKDAAEVIEIANERLQSMLAQQSPAATKLVTYIAKTLARRLAAVNQRLMARASTAAMPANATPAAASQPDATASEPAPAPSTPRDTILQEGDLQVLDELWSA